MTNGEKDHSNKEQQGLTPEQASFFDRAERMFGHGDYRKIIEDARADVIRRQNRDGVVRGGKPIIGFRPHTEDNPEK